MQVYWMMEDTIFWEEEPVYGEGFTLKETKGERDCWKT